MSPTERFDLSDYSIRRSQVSNPNGSYVFSSCSMVNSSPTERVNLSDYSSRRSQVSNPKGSNVFPSFCKVNLSPTERGWFTRLFH